MEHQAQELQIEKNKQILASKEDAEIFFDALMNPQEPNEALISAAKDYKEFLEKIQKKDE